MTVLYLLEGENFYEKEWVPLSYTGYRFFFNNLEKQLLFLFQPQWLISQ